MARQSKEVTMRKLTRVTELTNKGVPLTKATKMAGIALATWNKYGRTTTVSKVTFEEAFLNNTAVFVGRILSNTTLPINVRIGVLNTYVSSAKDTFGVSVNG